ncbi:hypothetical protein PAMC26510_26500 [Caballeronia sordidicola]|uniref:Uncharacterized protein n=1 Tax=Caballeronia sordidicola TaxID=196367 RepID=A0A242ME84_CABSO|nr:hypothetical protein PAMC26510_26500 [Caballeronia sordidicola]OTP74687.1 hypothetical protein PAMC26577_15420 [Caballeronia sordidicola]
MRLMTMACTTHALLHCTTRAYVNEINKTCLHAHNCWYRRERRCEPLTGACCEACFFVHECAAMAHACTASDTPRTNLR